MFKGFASVLIALLVSPAGAAAPPRATPAEIYGRLPAIEQAALSPDGSRIAFIRTTQDWRALAVFDFRTSKLVGGVRLGDAKIRSVQWADDENLLVTTATSQMPMDLRGEKTEWNLMVLYDLKSGKLRKLLDHVRADTTTMNVVYGRPIVQRKDGYTWIYVHGCTSRRVSPKPPCSA